MARLIRKRRRGRSDGHAGQTPVRPGARLDRRGAGIPIVLLCAAAIRLTSPGPAIFRQERVGRHGRPFICLKLRSMRSGTGDAPSHQTGAAAITPLGRWLRRLKLDELPQLWNVIAGDMSLVGPRPCLPTQAELIAARSRLGLDRIAPASPGCRRSPASIVRAPAPRGDGRHRPHRHVDRARSRACSPAPSPGSSGAGTRSATPPIRAPARQP